MRAVGGHGVHRGAHRVDGRRAFGRSHHELRPVAAAAAEEPAPGRARARPAAAISSRTASAAAISGPGASEEHTTRTSWP